ncbi:winged helix-turn-helix transcriptional regulator [Clostridioides sp. ZZV14-6387]|nr:winged helix-turn-helix transcriptional regulator [Clostridioides sp. ZZV14-6387]
MRKISIDKIEYSLTDLGISFVPVLENMKQLGKTYLSDDKNE